MRISDWSSDVCSSDLLVAALDLAGGSRLTLTAAAARSGSGYAVTAEAAADAVPVNDLARLWPSVVGASAREWVTTNLRDGVVPKATAQAAAWVDPADPGTLRIDRPGGRIDFADVTTHFFRPLPPATAAPGSPDSHAPNLHTPEDPPE